MIGASWLVPEYLPAFSCKTLYRQPFWDINSIRTIPMDSNGLFAELRPLLHQFEEHLSVLHDQEDNYYLNTPPTAGNKKAEFFGAVQIKKSYVAFHLMPVYYYPDLLDPISQELRSRMQGKSCFNFKELDKDLVAELGTLTQKAFDTYKALGKV